MTFFSLKILQFGKLAVPLHPLKKAMVPSSIG